MSEVATGSGRRWLLLPVLLVLVVYAMPALQADFVADDRLLIAQHQHPGAILGEWTTPTHGYATGGEPGYTWRPLTATLYHVWGGIFGRTPAPFRMLNVALHILNMFNFYAVARRLGAAAAGAAGLATIWAVHPALVDAVGWAADTCDLLSTAGMLGCAWLALGAGGWPRGLGLFIGLFLSLLAKESAVALAASLPLGLALLGRRRDAVAVALPLIAAAGLHQAWHRAVTGGLGAADFLVWPDFPAVWTDYLGGLFRPPLGAGFTHLVWPDAPPWSVGGVGVLVIGAGLAFAGRGRPACRALGGALVQWAALLTPAVAAAVMLRVAPVRYVYGPSALALAWLGGLGWAPAPQLRRALWAGLALWVGVAGWASRARLDRWRDERSLLVSEVRAEPDNPVAAGALGRAMWSAGFTEQGLHLWKVAIDRPPPSNAILDIQRERLDYAAAALQAGQVAEARAALDAFLAEEAAAGREVTPSVRGLQARIAATGGQPGEGQPPSPP